MCEYGLNYKANTYGDTEKGILYGKAQLDNFSVKQIKK